MNILRNVVLIVIMLRLSGHFCYVAPLKPSKLSDRFMYVLFETECTQDFKKCDGSF